MNGKEIAVLKPVIAFEGVDGCGKGTQAQKLKVLLEDNFKKRVGMSSVIPSHPHICGHLRDFVLNYGALDPVTELMTYLTSIHESMRDLREDESTDIGIADRSINSLGAYQLSGRLAGTDLINLYNGVVGNPAYNKYLIPDFVIILDVDYATQMARMERRGKLDHFEKMPKDFHDRVRYHYNSMPNVNTRCAVVNGMQSEEQVFGDILNALPPEVRDLFN